MSLRRGLRLVRASRPTPAAPSKLFGRRHQAVDATAAAAPPSQGTFQRIWNSPVGIKTVHFWAPVMKWALVLAGNAALTATGLIWTRWCFIIKPRNVFLAAVNFFLACVGVTQLSRIALYHQSLKDASPAEAIKGSAMEKEAPASEQNQKV